MQKLPSYIVTVKKTNNLYREIMLPKRAENEEYRTGTILSNVEESIVVNEIEKIILIETF